MVQTHYNIQISYIYTFRLDMCMFVNRMDDSQLEILLFPHHNQATDPRTSNLAYCQLDV